MSHLTLSDDLAPAPKRRDAKAQLARCNAALAVLRVAECPRWRRCEWCSGREDTTAPHNHGEAKNDAA